MSKEPSDRSIDAGKRLRVLRKRAFDKPISQLTLSIENKRWQEIVGISDPKAISSWENKGVPLEKLNSVTEFFYLESDELIDPEIEINDLIKKVRERIKNPDFFEQKKKTLTEEEAGKQTNEIHLSNSVVENLVSDVGSGQIQEQLSSINLQLNNFMTQTLNIQYSNAINEELQDIYNQAIDINEDDDVTDLYISLIWLKKKKYDEAILPCNKIIDRNAQYALAYFIRGTCLLRKREYESALSDFMQYLELDPTFSYAYVSCGTVYMVNRDFSTATKYFEKAIKLDPNDVLPYLTLSANYLAQNLSEDALIYLNQGIEINSKNPLCYLYRGLFYTTKKDFNKAIKDLNIFINLNPNESVGYLYRGIGLLYSDELEDAEADFNRYFELEPDDYVFMNHVGTLYFYLEKQQEAKEYFTNALELNKKFELTYLNLGTIYFLDYFLEENNISKAIGMFKKANELNPSNFLAQNLLYLSILGKDNLFKINQFWFQIKGNEIDEKSELGFVRLIDLDIENILSSCDKVININPECVFAHHLRSVLLLLVKYNFEEYNFEECNFEEVYSGLKKSIYDIGNGSSLVMPFYGVMPFYDVIPFYEILVMPFCEILFISEILKYFIESSYEASLFCIEGLFECFIEGLFDAAPETKAGYYYRGIINLKQKKFEPAIEDFSKFIELNINTYYTPLSYLCRGLTYFSMKYIENGIADLKKLLEYDSFHNGYDFYNLITLKFKKEIEDVLKLIQEDQEKYFDNELEYETLIKVLKFYAFIDT
ncbi:hypothetical protein [Desulfobacter postgatei]|uniref:hypothetical protein n=1 Tax=Desulfobacter postgatei TaxID=2293 RepID=UPI00259BC61A|nr:hypothetical protein [uncultured Desulfobacter sp.]